MHQDIHTGCNLSPHGCHWQVHRALEHHDLEAADHIPRPIRMSRRHGAVVPCIHRLEHVDSLLTAYLAYNDPIRSHAER